MTLLALPMSTLIALAVFRRTQRRAGVRFWHLVRVAMLGNDHRLIALPAVAVAYYVAFGVVTLLLEGMFDAFSGVDVGYIIEGHVLTVGLLLWPYATYRVVAAHLNYLKLPQPVTTALLVQAVPLLVIVVLAFWV